MLLQCHDVLFEIHCVSVPPVTDASIQHKMKGPINTLFERWKPHWCTYIATLSKVHVFVVYC